MIIFLIGFQNAAADVLKTQKKWSEFKKANFKNRDDIVVPINIELLFDGDSNDQIGKLTIHGGFLCAPGGRTLNVEGILVHGASAYFRCGSDESLRKDKFEILFSGSKEFGHSDVMCPEDANHTGVHTSGFQSFIITCGASLLLKGTTPNTPWTRLSATARPGDSKIKLSNTIRWPIDSEIVIASSSFDYSESETFKIMGYDSEDKLILDRPLKYRHWGEPSKMYGPHKLPLINQAEVAMLNRNIIIRGTEDKSAIAVRDGQDKKAAHLMFMSAPGLVQILGVEFNTVGRMGELGKYPIHWHRIRNTVNHYLRRSVIQNSFNRCVTIHETNNVWIRNNICFNHYGHGYFLEEGNEQFNRIERNLGLLSKPVPSGREILITDRTTDNPSRYDSPATFWISNPNNIVTNNVAAGSRGTGFWLAFKDDKHIPDGISVAPNMTPLLKFENNTAHSSHHGISVDGGPNGSCLGNPRNNCSDLEKFDIDTSDFNTFQTNYAPPLPAVFRGITVYKNKEYGFWFRAMKNSSIENSIFADNPLGVGLVFDVALRNSVVLFKTNQYDVQNELPKTVGALNAKRFGASLVYDGPSFLENVYFDNFMPFTFKDPISKKSYLYRPKVLFMTVAAAERGTAHQVKGLSYGPNMPPVLTDFFHDLGHPSKDNWASALVDLDGTLIGDINYAGYSLVPKVDISQVDGCLTNSRFANTFICPSRYGLIFLANGNFQFDLTRVDNRTGEEVNQNLPAGPHSNFPDIVPGAPYVNHQFSFPIEKVDEFQYQVKIKAPKTINGNSLNNMSGATALQAKWLRVGQRSPWIQLYQQGHFCRLIENSENSTLEAQVKDGDVLKFRLHANEEHSYGWRPNNVGSKLHGVYFQCYAPTFVSMLSPTVVDKGCHYYTGDQLVGCYTTTNPGKFQTWIKGKNIILNASVGPNRGIARIIIDDKIIRMVDFYNSTYVDKELILFSGAEIIEHKIYIEVTNVKNSNATGNFLVMKNISAN
jgi:hypothetical protein